MKKFLIFALALAALSGVATAQMDQQIISVSCVTGAVGTGTATIKGEIYSIRLDTTANKTQAVALVTAESETILSVAAATSDATYYPRIGVNKASDGTAITQVGAASDTGTNTVYDAIGVASVVTMTVTPTAATTGTNTTKAIITYKK